MDQNTFKPEDITIVVYADTTHGKDLALKQVHLGGANTSGLTPTNCKEVRVYGAASDTDPRSEIWEAILEAQSTKGILAIEDFSVFEMTPKEVYERLQDLYRAGAGISIRFFPVDMVSNFWRSEDAGGVPYSLFYGEDLERLIRALSPAIIFYEYFSFVEPGRSKLATREYKLIQRYLKEGLTRDQIAGKLEVSKPTVNRHIAKMRKLGLLAKK